MRVVGNIKRREVIIYQNISLSCFLPPPSQAPLFTQTTSKQERRPISEQKALKLGVLKIKRPDLD